MWEREFQILGNPKLVEFIFMLNRDYCRNQAVKVLVDTHVDVNRIENSKNTASVTFKMDVSNEAENVDLPFMIKVLLQGTFKWDDSLNEKDDLLEHMLKKRAPDILYGYALKEIERASENADIPMINIGKCL